MQYSKDETALILETLGYNVDRHYKFKIRDENTASASINPKDGKIKDFGSGWYGSIIDFMTTFENMSQKDAFSRANDIINRPQDIKFSSNQQPKFKKDTLSEIRAAAVVFGLNVIDNKSGIYVGYGENASDITKGYYWTISKIKPLDDLMVFDSKKEMEWLETDKHLYTEKTYSIKKEYITKMAALKNSFEIKKNKSEIANKGFITQDFIDKFQVERKENFKRFWELLSQTLPTATKEQKENIAKKYEIGYSKQADRLIMPIRNENGDCLTFWKYNKNPQPFVGDNGNLVTLPKVMFSKNRERCPFNLRDLKDFAKNQKDNETIFIVEGEKDCLNALASGFNAITLGSASARVSEKYIPLFKDINITIAYDNDEAGQSGAKALREDLKDVCKTIEVIDWNKIAKNVGIKEPLKKGFDFTDFLVARENIQEKKKDKER